MKIISQSIKDTLDFGGIVAGELRKGDIICLFGQLGSGKTVLTKGIAEGLGIKKNMIISPTFVLIRQYSQGKLPLYHFDLYRLDGSKDILGLGVEEYFYDEGITVIEWADRLGYLIPREYLKINLSIKSKSQRLFEFSAFGRRYKELFNNIGRKLKKRYGD